jgi:peptidoglycan/LPS O-acetylase OafA/YrhL
MTPNNLGAVRLTAAWMVLYGHSFVFLGQHEPLFLSWLPLGPLGVFIFFTISGYLVSESWDRDPNLIRFFQRRLLRILPGLAVCILLTVLVLGPFFTTLPISEYLAHKHTLGYLQNIALHIVYYLPGVFEHNRVANAVNGSLWSLPVEFLMYITLALVGVLHGKRWTMALLAVASVVCCILWAHVTTEMLVVYNFDLRQAFICGTYFWVGATFQKFGIQRHLSLSAGMLALFAMLCLEPWTQLLAWGSWVLLPIAVLAFGLADSPILVRLTRSGDYSYGIYIYAFPVQQAVVYLYPQIGIVTYLLVCTALTLILAIFSWHLIERRALSLKPGRPKPTNPMGSGA